MQELVHTNTARCPARIETDLFSAFPHTVIFSLHCSLFPALALALSTSQEFVSKRLEEDAASMLRPWARLLFQGLVCSV